MFRFPIPKLCSAGLMRLEVTQTRAMRLTRTTRWAHSQPQPLVRASALAPREHTHYTHAQREHVALAQARSAALEVHRTTGTSGWLPRPPAGYPMPYVRSAIAVMRDLSAALLQPTRACRLFSCFLLVYAMSQRTRASSLPYGYRLRPNYS